MFKQRLMQRVINSQIGVATGWQYLRNIKHFTCWNTMISTRVKIGITRNCVDYEGTKCPKNLWLKRYISSILKPGWKRWGILPECISKTKLRSVEGQR